jgi:hypothetical protein
MHDSPATIRTDLTRFVRDHPVPPGWWDCRWIAPVTARVGAACEREGDRT